jgi:hypothetical protein
MIKVISFRFIPRTYTKQESTSGIGKGQEILVKIVFGRTMKKASDIGDAIAQCGGARAQKQNAK